ncbi:MAG: ABC transporter substrate-binding protein [Nitrospirae bacterium]|nr:ABC transporter substrate-binding protein [Nitrospirota bacterium]
MSRVISHKRDRQYMHGSCYSRVEFFFWLVLATMISFGLQACSDVKESSSDAQELVIAVAQFGGFDPLTSYNLLTAMEVTEQLVEVDETSSLRPHLAERWERVDEKTWRFYLRNDVQFHDGTPFNATSAKFSLDRFFTIGSGTLVIPAIETIKVEDEYTLLLIFKEAGLFIPAYLAYQATAIISPNSIDEEGRLIKPIGTGPFKFESGYQRWEMHLVGYEKYWGGDVRLKRVTVKKIADARTRVLMLEAGEASFIETVPIHEVARLEANPKYKIVQSLTPSNVEMHFNLTREPFNELQVRGAIDALIDRSAFVTFFENTVIPAGAPFQPGLPWSVENSTVPSYDPEKAERLLTNAGWQMGADGIRSKEGKPFEIDLLVRGDMQEQVHTGEIVQGQLSKLGIRAHIKSLETGKFYEAMKEGNWHLAISGRGTLFVADPFAYLMTDYHSEGSFNLTGYQNETVDRLLERGRKEIDPEKRIEICKQVQQILIDENPTIVLYHPYRIYAASAKVQALRLKSPATSYAYLTLGEAYIGEEGEGQ